MKLSKIGYGAMIVLYFGVLGYAAKKLHDECKTTYKQDFKIPITDENVNDYYKLEKIDPDRAVWKPAKGEERKIRLVLNDWRVEVFVDDGDEPVVSTQKYAMTIERSPEIGYASFVGDNVKISNIAVRKPQLHTGGK